MIHRFSADLTIQEIAANGNELANIMGMDMDDEGKRIYHYPDDREIHVATFMHPVLVSDNYRACQLSPAKRDTVITLLNASKKIIEYDDVKLNFDQSKYPGLWGPSIDTLLFCKALRNVPFWNVGKIVEIGAGSGFISKYILEKVPHSLVSYTVDINPYSKKCIEDNGIPCASVVQDGIEFLERIPEANFDMILCNPPYIPRPGAIDDNAYEGVSLLKFLIQDAHKFLKPGGCIITNISSLSRNIIDELIKDSGIKVEVLASMEVPLKVYNILNNPKWIKYLKKNGLQDRPVDGYDYWSGAKTRDIGLKKIPGYDYWQTIEIVKIEKMG